MPRLYLLLADALLVLHALIVLFNVGALPVIWVGHFRGWKFVRAFSFRAAHLLLIGFVAAQSRSRGDLPADDLGRRAAREGRG